MHMKNIAKIWFVTFTGVIVPMSLWNIYYIFGLGNCEFKLGCEGTFISETMGLIFWALISSFSILYVYLLFIWQNIIKYEKPILIITFISGIILSFLLIHFYSYSIFDFDRLTASFWAITSFIIGCIAYAFQMILINRTSNAHGKE